MSLTLHKHPQKTAYLSETDWPTRSGQGHWRQPSGVIGHIHFDLTFPEVAEIAGPVVCPFAIHLFRFQGQASFGDRVELVRDVIWDGGGIPILRGDPLGERIWTGTLTVDPRLPASHPAPAHGFFVALIEASVFFDNGDSGNLQINPSFYSVIDPEAPERAGFPLWRSNFSPVSKASGVAWGNNYVSLEGYLPVAPIAAPWPIRVGTAGYGARDLGAATYEQRADLDLHNNIPGRLLDQVVAVGDISRDAVFDPGPVGLGPHKYAFFRTQPDGQEQVSTLAVLTVTVGEGGPPPKTVAVPTLVGMRQADAEAELAALGLRSAVQTQPAPEPAGTVIGQSPAPGLLVQVGTIVDLLVSSGAPAEEWHQVMEPVIVEQFGTGPRRRLRVGNLAMELTEPA